MVNQQQAADVALWMWAAHCRSHYLEAQTSLRTAPGFHKAPLLCRCMQQNPPIVRQLLTLGHLLDSKVHDAIDIALPEILDELLMGGPDTNAT